MQKLNSVLHFPQESIEHLGDGFYNACIAIDSHIPSSTQIKTFFPAHWTRKEVMECIVSRLKNAKLIKKTVDKYGEKWIFISQYNDALNIKYIFDTENFSFKSIFPIKK